MRVPGRASFTVVATVALAAPAAAQCANVWLQGAGIAGVGPAAPDAVVRWDPDGPGSQTEVLVLAGNLTLAGTLAVDGVATWDPATAQFGTLAPVPGYVNTVAAHQNGDLFVGGAYRWNGVGWTSLPPQPVPSMGTTESAVLANGHLLANAFWWTGGPFGIVTNAALSRWDGVSWTVLFTTTSASVGPIVALPGGGAVCAVGSQLRYFNGGTVTALGPPVAGIITALALLPNGDFIAGGTFATAGGIPANNIARFDGTAWSALGSGTDANVASLDVLSNSDVIAAGWFTTAGGIAAHRIARWNGSNWSAVDGGNDLPPVTVTALSNGDLIAAGPFESVLGQPAHRLARWDGATWQALTTVTAGVGEPVFDLAMAQNGDVFAVSHRVHRWDGTAWSVVGHANDVIAAVAVLPNGNVVVGGAFTAIDNLAASYIAEWNGVAWAPLGSGCSNFVEALTVLPNGHLVAGGLFTTAGGVAANRVAEWNGTSWAPLGSGFNAAVFALAVDSAGELLAGGRFVLAGSVAVNAIARWNGSSWLPLGAGLGTGYPRVNSIATSPGGDIVVAGQFNMAGGNPATNVARWDGTSWSALGTGLVGTPWATTVLPGGDVVVGGMFQLGGSFNLARWSGNAWTALAGGTDEPVRALIALPGGDLAVGGAFMTVGATGSAYFGRLSTTCPALLGPIATACVGSTGPVLLSGDTLPWVGSTFRSTASGFAANSLAVSLLGLTSPNVPLTWLWANTGPGCDQLASHDAILLHLPQNGSTGYAFTIPNDVVFAGLPLFHQFLQFEVNAQNQLTVLSASNGLALTIGAF